MDPSSNLNNMNNPNNQLKPAFTPQHQGNLSQTNRPNLSFSTIGASHLGPQNPSMMNMMAANASPTQKSKNGDSQKAPSFQKYGFLDDQDISNIMYGHGDEAEVDPESLALLKKIAEDYIYDMTIQSMHMAAKAGRNRVALEDLGFLVRKNNQKYSRIKELLRSYDEIKYTKNAVDLKGLISNDRD